MHIYYSYFEVLNIANIAIHQSNHKRDSFIWVYRNMAQDNNKLYEYKCFLICRLVGGNIAAEK